MTERETTHMKDVCKRCGAIEGTPEYAQPCDPDRPSKRETCANPRCLNGANCPGHPWMADELEQLGFLETTSHDMNDAGYRGAGFRQAREFFGPRAEAAKQRVRKLEEGIKLGLHQRMNEAGKHAGTAWDLEQCSAKLATAVEALRELAGQYGCGLVEPPDPSLPAAGESCRERHPDDSFQWCYCCIATQALSEIEGDEDS